MLFTSTNHSPYQTPESFEPKIQGEPWEETAQYADWALGHFFKLAEQQSWYQNTLFVIVADHVGYSDSLNNKQRARIPLLFFTPNGFLKAKINNRLGSHIDIMPTLFDLLNWEVTHASVGKSLFAETDEAFATFVSGGSTWWKGDKAYQFYGDKLLGVYNAVEDPDFQQPLSLAEPQAQKVYNAWRKVVQWVVIKNKIVPKTAINPN